MIALTLTPEGAEFIARFEGFRATPYRCPAGKLTIGYGHVIQGTETLVEISQGDALSLLQQDATREAAPVVRALAMPLTSYQADALISLSFNCGGRAIARSTLIQRLNAGLLSDAAEEFLKWNRIGKVESRGLTRRRQAERDLFLTGHYGSD
jgi:lysozyme